MADLFRVATGSIGADQKPIYDVFSGTEHIKDPADPRLAGKDIASLPDGQSPAGFKSVFEAPGSLDASKLATDSQVLAVLMAKNEALKKQNEADKLASLLPANIVEPATIDYVGKVAGLNQSYGINEINQNITNKNQEILKLQDSFKAGSNAIEGQNKEMTMSAVRGEQAVLGKQAQEKLDTLLREKSLMVEDLGVKTNQVNQIMQWTKTGYDDAVAQVDRAFSRNFAIQGAMQDYKTAEEAKIGKTETTAKANLDTQIEMMTKNKVTWDKLTPEAQNSFNILAMKAGISPEIYREVLSLEPEKVIKNTIMSKDNTQGVVMYEDGTMTPFNTGFNPEGSGGSGTQTEREKSIVTKDTNDIVNFWTTNNIIQGNGKIASVDYQKAKNVWVREGYTAKDFDGRFSGYADKSSDTWKNDYGIE